MIFRSFLSATVFIVVRSATLPHSESPSDVLSCGSRLPAFVLSTDKKLDDKPDYTYKNVSEYECSYICSDSEDKAGTSIKCASLTYNRKTRKCNIYARKAEPTGDKELIFTPGIDYLEKVCLPDGSPISCGEQKFPRLDQIVIKGFAFDMVKTKRMDMCLQACIENNGLCQSVMFFHESGECILNKGTADDAEESLSEEKKDKVVYIEINCLKNTDKKITTEESQKPRLQSLAAKKSSTISASHTVAPTTRISKTSSASTSTTTASPLIEKREKTGIRKTQSEKENKQEGTEEDEENDLNLTEKLSVQKEKVKEEKTEVKQERTGKTEGLGLWEAWSECDRDKDGRQIRRRKCQGDKAFCEARTMESRPCSKPDSVVDEEDDDGDSDTRTPLPSKPRHPSAGTVANTGNDEEQSGSPALDQRFGAWSKWSKKCHKFRTEQPCTNERQVGFQTRQCLGNPFQCHGPSLRYCMISC
uniref:Apple domain-containing protein n=1 Tax=Romanomermis culicivorax TaxID=13658 RepID=A0A915ISI1_ROMCU